MHRIHAQAASISYMHAISCLMAMSHGGAHCLILSVQPAIRVLRLPLDLLQPCVLIDQAANEGVFCGRGTIDQTVAARAWAVAHPRCCLRVTVRSSAAAGARRWRSPRVLGQRVELSSTDAGIESRQGALLAFSCLRWSSEALRFFVSTTLSLLTLAMRARKAALSARTLRNACARSS